MKEFFNTEITQTLGSQLLLALVIFLISGLIFKPIVRQIEKGAKKVYNLIKNRIKELFNTPYLKQFRIYWEIKKAEKKNNELKPQQYPIGAPIRLVLDFLRRNENGESLEYKPLNDLMIKYVDSYKERLEKYYEKYPEEKIEDDLRKKNLLKIKNRLLIP